MVIRSGTVPPPSTRCTEAMPAGSKRTPEECQTFQTLYVEHTPTSDAEWKAFATIYNAMPGVAQRTTASLRSFCSRTKTPTQTDDRQSHTIHSLKDWTSYTTREAKYAKKTRKLIASKNSTIASLKTRIIKVESELAELESESHMRMCGQVEAVSEYLHSVLKRNQKQKGASK